MLHAFNSFMSLVGGSVNVYGLFALVVAILTLVVLYLISNKAVDGIKVTRTSQWGSRRTQVKVWKAGALRKPLSGTYTISKRG